MPPLLVIPPTPEEEADLLEKERQIDALSDELLDLAHTGKARCAVERVKRRRSGELPVVSRPKE